MTGTIDSFAILSGAQARVSKRRIGRYRSVTALAGGLAATILLAMPAAAQDTHGGRGGQGNVSGAPAGGTSSSAGAGGDGGGTSESYEGAAGGGAGATGGKGGDASNGGAGGAGGATAGASGGDGVGGGIGSRASGGGGGAHGAVLLGAPGSAATGGDGGKGGTSEDGDGGGGGAGGYGAVVTGGGGVFNYGITGGKGGDGGAGYFYGGGGGDGGHGLLFTGPATATINAAVAGGNGGSGGTIFQACCAAGAPGGGGIGIIGSDVNLTIGAGVSGGLSGNGVTRALAMRLGGASSLILTTGWSFTGGIEIAGGSLDIGTTSLFQVLPTAISGSGTLIKSDSSTLILTGTNSYSGGTIINGGMLQVGGNTGGSVTGTLGSGQITNNATLAFARADDIGVANTISGSGNLTKLGGGVLTLSGNNSYSGGTTISDGTLLLGSAAALGTGDVVLDGGTLDVAGFTFDLPQTISGSGTIIASGGGGLNIGTGETIAFGSASGSITSGLMLAVDSTSTLALGGNNALTGGILLAGRLRINNSGAAGSNNTIFTTGSVISYADGVDNGAAIGLGSDTTQLEVLGTDTAYQSGTIYEDLQSRGFEKIGTGTLILTAGNNSYTGTTRVSAGTLGLGNDTAAGTGQILLANGATLLNAACGCGTLTLTNAIEAAAGGTATIDAGDLESVLAGDLTGGNFRFGDSVGFGTVTLTGANSYGDTTVDAAVMLRVGDGGTTGTLGTGTVHVDGLLAFNRSDDITISTAIDGNGTLQQSGTGTLTLTGANSYSGGTAIEFGTLQVGDGGTTGALGTGDIFNDAALVLNRSDDITIADDIIGSNTSTITKLGAGTLTLTGMNASNSGTLSVQNGTVAFTEIGLGLGTVEIDNDALLKPLEDAFAGYVNVLSNGGTIDTGGFTFEIVGAIDFQGELTKTGAGTLIITDTFEEGDGAGGINVLEGTLGLGSDFAGGTGILKFADGTTLLACGCFGTLDVDNAIQIAAGGTLTIDGDGNDIDLNGPISGGDISFTAGSSPGSASTFELNGANSYGNSLIGPNVALIVDDGTLGAGDVTFDPAPSDPLTPSALVFQNSTDYSYGGKIVGAGIVSIEASAGRTVTLAGSNSAADNFTGTVDVSRGRLAINGDFGDVVGNSATLLVDDAFGCGCGAALRTLGGSGTFHGSVTIGAGSLAPGNSPGTLTITGDLTLGAASILDYELGVPGTVGGAGNDLTNVGGDLRLDGTLNILSAGAGYGPGYYRLFNYGGALSGPGLTTGSIAAGAGPATVLTNIGGQVNLYLGGAQIIQYWDGADTTGASAATGGDGGAGIWNDMPTNWTVPADYSINDAWQNQVGVFAGAAGGTVTVMNEQAFEELRFETDGYVLTPFNATARLTAGAGFSIIDVAGGIGTDIGVIIQGGGIDKTGGGTLTLSAANEYTGPTDIAAGTLVLAATGSIAGAVNNNATFTNAGTVAGLVTNTVILTSTGTLNGGLDNSGTASISGVLSGAVANSGTIELTGTTTGIGAVDQAGGTFLLNGFDTSFGSLTGTGTIALGSALLTVGGDGTSTSFDGAITGSGGLTKAGTGTLTLTAAQGYTGLTTVADGALTLGAGGSLAGDVHNLSLFTNAGTVSGLVDNDGTLVSTGTLAGGLLNDGSASLQGTVSSIVNNAAVNITGAATVATVQQASTGTFNLGGFGVSVGTLTGEGTVALGGGTFTVGIGNGSSSFAGTFTGGGTLAKAGTGTFTLASAGSNPATIDIAAGTLRLGIDNAIFFQSALNVQAGATFDLAGFHTSVGSLAGVGAITLNNGRLDIGQNGASTSFSGTITGTGGTSVFTKNGSGTLTLSGSIALGSSPTLEAFAQVNGGTLLITGTGSLSADLIQNFSTIENSGTIDAGLILQSFGTLTNTGTGTITGITQNFATFDNYGTMASLQSISGTAVNHSTGVINGSVQTFATFTSTGIINGALSNFGTALIENQVNGQLANVQNGATVTLTGATTGITNYTGEQGSLLDLAGFNTIVGALNGGGGDIQLGGATLTVDNSSIAFSDYAGSIIGAGALVKTGSGEQILRGVSSYTGATAVNAGRLVVADTGALTSDVTIANGASFSNGGTVAGLTTNSGTLTASGIFNGNLVNNSDGVVTAQGQINGQIENAGGFTVSDTLAGVVSFSQAAGGQLALNADFSVGELSGTGTVDTQSYTLTVGGGGADTSFGGAITGSGGLTKIGNGSFTLTGTNSYTGETLVSAGTLGVSSSGTIAGLVRNDASLVSEGRIEGGLINNGSALLGEIVNGRIENQSGSITVTGDLAGNGRLVQSNGAIFSLSIYNASLGSLSGGGTVALGAGRLTLGSDNTSTSFAGTITGSGGISKSGEGTMTLTGVSTYGDTTIIDGGMLQLGEGGAIGGGDVVNGSFLGFDGITDRSFGNAISGSGAVVKTGTNVLTLTGANSYGGGTTVSQGIVAFTGNQSLGSGTIRLASATGLRNANGGTAVALANDIEIETGTLATLSGVGGSSTTLSGSIIDGNARFAAAGAGTAAFTLTGANFYGHTQIGAGATVTLAGSGTLGAGDTLLESGTAGLVFANAGNYSYGGQIAGNGTILVNTAPAAAITLTGSNFAGSDFTGTVTIDAGKLLLNGDFGDVTGNTANMMVNGGSLGGGGVFHGNIDMSGGTLSPGNSPGTLNIAGNLLLGAGTILNFELAQSGVVGSNINDLVNVGGNLRLDGTLNVTALAGFGEGYYRLFNYGGTLTDNGLLFGAMPAGYSPSLLTNIGGQVNILFASSPQAIQYWDGGDQTGGSTVTGGNGGTGVWNGTNTNWTAPTGYGVNDSWRGQVAVFGGAAGGTVTVQGTQAFQELRFRTVGYVLDGATVADGLATTGGFSVIDVAGGADGRINAVISGNGGLTKTGDGALSLGGANSYTGVTTVSGGALIVLAGGSLAGGVVNDSYFENRGTIAGQVVNNSTMVSTGTLNGGLDNGGTASIQGVLNGAVANATGGTITLTGATTGIGAMTQSGNGRFDLAGFDTSFGSLAGTGTVALGSAALTVGGNNGSTSFSGVISGSGGLTKTGTGQFGLAGVNSYTGLTTVSAGTLTVTATGALAGNVRNDATFNNAGSVGGTVTSTGTTANTGTIAGLVTNSGMLTSNGTLAGGLDNSGTVLIGGTLSGAVANSGTIELGGTTTGIGAVTQTAPGSFRLGGFNTSFGSLAGAGTVDLGSALLTTGGSNASTSFAGAISGSGGLTKAGTGIFTLTGANSYTGLTTVSAGTLALGAGGSLAGNVRNQASFTNAGTVAGTVQNDATLANSGTITGAVANGGTLTSTGTLAGGLLNNGTASLQGTIGTGIVNNGGVTFTGAATVVALQQAATGSTSLAGFGVSIGTIAGSGTIALGSGALGVGAGNGNSSFAGMISGSGGLTKTGTGTLLLTGANSYTGTTTISGGTLQIGDGGTTGSITGAVANNGMLVLSRNDAVTFANAMSGTGGFVQAGTGTTTLTGANSYTGGTLVSAGRLRGDTGSLQGSIRIDGALEFAQTGAGTYSGSISGAGLFQKSGAGALSMTGDSSTFTGATQVLAGRLAVNGLLSRSIVTVGNGATLGGTGTVGGVVVQGGGTLAPGNSVGTFNVAGNVLFQAGSLFAVEVQASGADRVQATGTAQLNGTLQLINLGGNYGINATFVLLHADAGVSGTFATTDFSSFGPAFRPKIVYSANEVQLILAPNQLSAVLGTGVPLSYNQRSTIGRIDAAVAAGYDPGALAALYSLAPAAIPAALDSFSGEIYADATRAAMEDERIVREAAIGRLAEAADAGLTGNGAWGQVIGSWGSVDGDGNAAGYDANRTGMIMGLDGGAETDDGSWRAGVMGHYTRITAPAAGRGSRATIDRTGGGLYAGAATGNWRVRAGASVALLDMKAKREINIAGITGIARGKSQGTMLQTFAEISYRIDAGGGSFVEPYLAGSASRVQFGRFAETSGPVPLIVHAQKNVLGVGELGLRGTAALGGGDAGGVRLGGNIGLRTAFGDRTANPVIALAAMPDQGFNIHSAEIDRFAAVANLNLSVDVSETLSLRIGYSGVQGANMREHGGRATLSLRF